MKSYVIDVQRCSIHDGPGIRTTVFLKGCPLKCKWCHNPESQNFQRELSFNHSLCVNCGKCVEVCLAKAHKMMNDLHIVDFSKCNLCGECTRACPTKALTIIGKDITPKEVFDIVIKDKAFYTQGGGGLTISGGEALSHVEYCVELLKLCKEKEIHTCIETSGYASHSSIEEVLPFVDLFLFDFKVSNEQTAKDYVGGSMESIRRSFEYIYEQGKDIVLRCPIIPGVNDKVEHFKRIGELTINYPNLLSVELLPYHNFGISKGKNIGRASEEFISPTREQKQEWMEFFHTNGYTEVKIS